MAAFGLGDDLGIGVAGSMFRGGGPPVTLATLGSLRPTGGNTGGEEEATSLSFFTLRFFLALHCN